MATERTAEECGALILSAFNHYNVKEGQVLMPGQLESFTALNSISNAEQIAGLQFGGEQGWFENGPNGSIKLTKIGFAAM